MSLLPKFIHYTVKSTGKYIQVSEFQLKSNTYQ